jgi:hypothetical protein
MKEAVYLNSPFDTAERARTIVPLLLSTSDPEAEEIILVQSGQKTVFSGEELQNARQDRTAAEKLVASLRDCESFQIRGAFQEKGKYSLQTDLTSVKPSITIQAEEDETADALIHDLSVAASQMFPDAFINDEELTLTINYVRESMTAGKMLILNHDTAEKDYLASRLAFYEINEGMGPHIHTIGIPFFYAERDWVMRLSFNPDGSLSIVSLRLIVGRDDGTAVYEQLNEDELSRGFDDVTALLSRESGLGMGVKRKEQGLVLYGWEKKNVMAVKDTENGCVDLNMMFQVRRNG